MKISSHSHPELFNALKDGGFIAPEEASTLVKFYPWLLVSAVDREGRPLFCCELKDFSYFIKRENPDEFWVCITDGLTNLLSAMFNLPHAQSKQEMEGLN